jgi:hypothetical protein
MRGTLFRNALVAWAALMASGPGLARGADAGDWRAARWGMSEDDVLKAFPGEATPLEKPLKLADGNTVAIGIEKHAIGATEFRTRFVFDPAGKLALVSLRTDPAVYAGPGVYDGTKRELEKRLGPPSAASTDDNFVDLRQASWWTARSRIDLKYVNGVVVVLYSPTDGGPPAAARSGVPPLLAKPPEAPARR